MVPLLLFAAALPIALVANFLIQRFSRNESEPEEENHQPVLRLPWHAKPWSDWLRRIVVFSLPALAVAAGLRFDLLQAFAVTLFLAALLICTATDLLAYRVPNAITYPGTLLAVVAALLMPDASLRDALLAAAAGGAIFFLIALISRGGLGLGDVKLAVLIGAALGPQAGYEAMLVGVSAGGVILLLLLVSGFVDRRQAVPYAPFLALAAAAVVLLRGASFAPL